MKCDIIIPAYNSRSVLPATLQALFAQDISSSYSISLIISDDGSTDDTVSWLQTIPVPQPWRLVVITGPHTGPGGARNRALAASGAEIVFFLGADIQLRPGALQAHLDFHVRYPDERAAALGLVKWDPRLPPSRLMEWMIHGGQQNNFDDLLGVSTAAPEHFFYGSHLSLKRRLLPKPAFTPHLTGSWEDLELGRRLAARGCRLHVLHHAIGLHHHFYPATAIARRQYQAGYSLQQYQALYPSLPLIPNRSRLNHLRRWIFCVCGGQLVLYILVRASQDHYSLPWIWTVFTANQLWKGLWASTGSFLAFLSQSKRFSAENQ